MHNDPFFTDALSAPVFMESSGRSADAADAVDAADAAPVLDEHFHWHRIRRMPRK